MLYRDWSLLTGPPNVQPNSLVHRICCSAHSYISTDASGKSIDFAWSIAKLIGNPRCHLHNTVRIKARFSFVRPPSCVPTWLSLPGMLRFWCHASSSMSVKASLDRGQRSSTNPRSSTGDLGRHCDQKLFVQCYYCSVEDLQWQHARTRLAFMDIFRNS